MSEFGSELAKALVAFQKELPKVSKDRTANIGAYSYKYTDLASLTQAVLPLLTKHGLAFISSGRATENGYELVGMLVHESGESIEGSLPVHGRTPQEIGSSLTYSRRYILCAMTGVVSDDEDDAHKANKSERLTAKDWDSVADTAESLTDVDALKALWRTEQVGKAPKVIQDRVKAHGELLAKEAGNES